MLRIIKLSFQICRLTLRGDKRKISESINIVQSEIPVYLINGFYPERMIDIINGSDFIGTSIKMQEQQKQEEGSIE